MKKLLTLTVLFCILSGIYAQNYFYLDRHGKTIADTANYEYKIADDYTLFRTNNLFGVKQADGTVFFEAKFAQIVYLGKHFFALKPDAKSGFDIYFQKNKKNEPGKTYQLLAAKGVKARNGFIDDMLCLGIFGTKEYSVLLADGSFLKYHSKPQLDVNHIIFPDEFIIYSKQTKEYIPTPKLKDAYTIAEFSDGIAAITVKNSKGEKSFGFIDMEGKILIKPTDEIKKADGFYGGTCNVAYNRYIDTKGKIHEVKDFNKANFGVNNHINISFVETGGIANLRLLNRRTGALDTLKLGIQANNDSDFPKFLAVNGFSVVEGQKKMNYSGKFPAYVINQDGKVVHKFAHTSTGSGKLSDRAFFADDLLLITSFIDSSTVVINNDGQVLSTFDKKVACTVSNGILKCKNQEPFKIIPKEKVKTTTTVSSNESTVVSWAVAIVLKRTRSSMGSYSTDYFCRYIVVEDSSNGDKESARQFAVSHYNKNFLTVDKNCVIAETFVVQDDLDKCKEIANAKYKLSDWEVDYTYKK